MSKKVFDIKLIESTRLAHIYGDLGGAEVVVPRMYMKKTGLPSNPPQTITVTLDYEVEGS